LWGETVYCGKIAIIKIKKYKVLKKEQKMSPKKESNDEVGASEKALGANIECGCAV
jgi:hypothetical protein